jgi:hypothetical protein
VPDFAQCGRIDDGTMATTQCADCKIADNDFRSCALCEPYVGEKDNQSVAHVRVLAMIGPRGLGNDARYRTVQHDEEIGSTVASSDVDTQGFRWDLRHTSHVMINKRGFFARYTH